MDKSRKKLKNDKRFLKDGFGLNCDTANDVENKKIRTQSYDLIFVHLSMHAGEEKPASVVRKRQKNAFIVGVGGELRSHYSQEDLAGCDDFYGKAGGIGVDTYFTNLLNELGVRGR